MGIELVELVLGTVFGYGFGEKAVDLLGGGADSLGAGTGHRLHAGRIDVTLDLRRRVSREIIVEESRMGGIGPEVIEFQMEIIIETVGRHR